MKQTAVESLFDELKKHKLLVKPYTKGVNSLFEKAKQMEKEQLKDAHIEGQRVFDKHDHTQWTNDKAEQYYNETYGKQEIEKL